MHIVFEDEKILVVEKQAGVTTTNEGVNAGNSLENWLYENYFWAKKITRGGICHRLDKNTSGIVLIAKKQEVCDAIKGMFKERLVVKAYQALVGGRVPIAGCVVAPMGRSSFFAKRKIDVEGKMAVTYFEILRRYKDNEGKSFTLLKLFPKTGRTHQLRVHCHYMGWPIVGDGLYGGDQRYLKGRQFLHACELGLKFGGKDYNFKVELPLDLEETLMCYEKVV